MVALYVGGRKIGSWAEGEKLLAEFAARNSPVEFRDEAGELVGTFVPRSSPEPIIPWEPAVTREEIERRKAEPGLPFEEVKKRLGWQ